MKQYIETALRPLLGEPLTDMWRYAGSQKFEFGVQRRRRNNQDEEYTSADWGLVVSCAWSIAGPEGCIVSSDQFGPQLGRRDQRAKPFYELLATGPPVVESIEADEEGALVIQMSGGYILAVQPEADIDPMDEQWRLMPPDGEQSHLVLWGDGLEVDEPCVE